MTQHILVFSDPHGRIPLLLRLVWQFQRERGVRVDTVLVTGDLGVWPDLNRLDSSTRKFCRQEPAELSFLCFESLYSCDNSRHELFPGTYLRKASRLLDQILPEIAAKIIFVGGNHEDYQYLDACCLHATRNVNASSESGGFPVVAVESSGLLCWLPPGALLKLEEVTVAGLSGIDAEADGRNPDRYHASANLNEDRILDSALQILEQSGAHGLDLFLSHDGPPDAVKPGKGSIRLFEAIQALNPKYHFFGHYHRSVVPASYADLYSDLSESDAKSQMRTIGMHVNKLAFCKGSSRLRDQVVCHLQIESGQITADFVEDPWLKDLTPADVFRV